MAQYNSDRYLYPPRAKLVIPFTDRPARDALAAYGYQAQYKVNDSRALIKYLPDGRIQLWNRHGEMFRDYSPSPQLHDQLHALPELLGLDRSQHQLLDGGIIDKKHRAIKHTLAVWDILVRDGQHLKHTTYQERHDSLLARAGADYLYPQGTTVGRQLTPDVFVPTSHGPEQWDQLWTAVLHENQGHDAPLLEGLVFKRGDGLLGPGVKPDNNSDWMCRSRVTTGRHQF